MTDWTTISDSQVEPNSPVTSELMSSLRDNPVAISEGAIGAPPILVNALGVFTAGTTRRYYSTDDFGTTSNTYVTVFNRSLGGSGTLRLKFDWKNDTAATNGSARILVNGVQVAVFSSTDVFVTTSTDVTLVTGSKIEIQVSAFNGTTILKNIELLTAGEEIMFIADQEGVTFG